MLKKKKNKVEKQKKNPTAPKVIMIPVSTKKNLF